MSNTRPIQHRRQHKHRVKHIFPSRGFKIVFANGTDNSILRAATFAKGRIAPHALAGRAALTKQQIHDNIKNIVGIRRLHGQLVAEEGTAILSDPDNVRLAGNRIHRCPAAIFVEFVPYNVRGHRAALFWGKKTHVKRLTFFLAAQV